ncbi:MAG: hypothetical protein K9H16_12900, partial [Bacteroidales bacterium]|nr:hypothetical protein [Bacteroidales bacterium]
MICFLALEAEAQNDKYYRISIDDIDKTLDKLSQSDISLEYLKSENHLLLEVSGYELSLLDDLNIDYEIIISDLQEFYSSRNRG